MLTRGLLDGPPPRRHYRAWPNYVDAHKCLFENDMGRESSRRTFLLRRDPAQLERGWISPLSSTLRVGGEQSNERSRDSGSR